MKSRYFLLFLILAIVLVLLFYYFRLVDLSYSEKAIFKTKSTKEDIHTVLEDGVWSIEHPDFIPQFGGDLQNTGVYPGDGIRGIQKIESDLTYHIGSWWPYHVCKLVYKIRHKGLICSVPAVYDRIIYFGTNDGHFYAIDIDSCEEKWVVRIGSASEKKRDMYVKTDSCPPASAIFSSPVIYDDMAFFGTAYGYVYALDIKDGSIIWKAEIPGLHLANPKVYNDCLYIGSKDRHLYKLNAKTGNTAWKYETQGEITTTPAIYEDKVFINCQKGYLYAINTEGNLSWKIDMGLPTRNSPVIYEGIVFLDAYYFHAFKSTNGREIWKAGPFSEASQCAASKGMVYFSGVIIGDKDKNYRYKYLYSFIARNGKEAWKHRISSWKIPADTPAWYILDDVLETQEALNSEVPSKQLIISGDMIHLLSIANDWRESHEYPYYLRSGEHFFYRGIGKIFGISENVDRHYPQDNRRGNIYAYGVGGLHSPVAIYDEAMYYGAEIYDKDGCHTALYAMQSMQDEYRWQPRPRDWSISYPMMSENIIVLYDLIAKDKDNMQKEENSYLDTNLYTAEFHIVAYDIQSKEEIYSGTYDMHETAPLTIFRRSSATHSNKLFIEAGILRKIEREEISDESVLISQKVPTPSGVSKKYSERQLISNSYYAFDIQTGMLLWKYNLGQKILNSPPLVYEDNIYIGSCYILDDLFDVPDNLKDSYNIFIALGSEDGEEIWEVEIIGNVLSKPLIYNDILYFGTDKGYVYAIDRFEGEILWKFYINGGISTTPAVYNDIIFIGSWNWNIYAIDAKTGKGKWKYRTRGEVRGELIAHEDHLYVLSRIPMKDPGSIVLKDIEHLIYLQSVNINNGIEEWNYWMFGRLNPSSLILLYSDKIYMLDAYNESGGFYGSLKEIDLKTGTVIWEKKTEDYEDYKEFRFSDSFFKFFKDRIFIMSLIKGEKFIMIIDANTGETLQSCMLKDMKLHFGP